MANSFRCENTKCRITVRFLLHFMYISMKTKESDFFKGGFSVL